MIIPRDNAKDLHVHAHRQSVCVFLKLASASKLIVVSFKSVREREFILLFLKLRSVISNYFYY